jgi:hypothetical protein
MLASLGRSLRAEERERDFDEGAALRRLAEDAGYRTSDAGCRASLSDLPAVAGRQLMVVVGWSLEQPGASEHVEHLAEAIGRKKGCGIEDGVILLVRVSELAEVDVDGAHVFACMLYQARHHDSAQFWWEFAAGAGKGIAAFCLHLHHLARGEMLEAEHWLQMLSSMDSTEMLDADFIRVTRWFAAWKSRQPMLSRGPVPALTHEVHRLATISNVDEALVCRPDHELASRLQEPA